MKKWKIKILIIGSVIGWGIIILFDTFKIPTHSMDNSIPAGTRIIVLKAKLTPTRFEPIVFRNPEGDTVVRPYMPQGYYSLIRSNGREMVNKQYKKIFVPLNKREIWIGRCVGIPGDIIKIRDARLFVNGSKYDNPHVLKYYTVILKENQPIHPKVLEKFNIIPANVHKTPRGIEMALSRYQTNQLKKLPAVRSITMKLDTGWIDPRIFPFSDSIHWNKDHFGELVIPGKGTTIKLNLKKLPIYERLITNYEQNELVVSEGKIYINGKQTNTYTPKMNYYFIVSDNRDNAVDSRFWGFLPENHIFGKIIVKL